jgi:hypothetical protein
MVSNLPIHSGDRIVAIPLVANSHNCRGIIATDFWAPFLPHIRGNYDDYGGIENTDDIFFETVAKKFLLPDSDLLKLNGDEFVIELIRLINELDFKFDFNEVAKYNHIAYPPQNSEFKIQIAFVHEKIYDFMIKKSAYAKEVWNFVLEATTPFELQSRYKEGIFCQRHAFYPSSLILMKAFEGLDKSEVQNRVKEMTKFSYALDESRRSYNPTVGSGSQASVEKFALDLTREIADMARKGYARYR